MTENPRNAMVWARRYLKNEFGDPRFFIESYHFLPSVKVLTKSVCGKFLGVNALKFLMISTTYIPLKTWTSFSSPWWTSQSLTKASSFPINLSVFCVSNTRGSPRGMLMLSPQGCDKIVNAPPPGLTTWANAPWLPGGGDGHRWNASSELLYKSKLDHKFLWVIGW